MGLDLPDGALDLFLFFLFFIFYCLLKNDDSGPQTVLGIQ